ncbi:MAG: GHMP kinase [Arcicella sp.]|jgi:galactokinase|nr:GHMP kinase [Arcicella sp.]
MRSNSVEISTPGRICLFGEHQDYLGLPIVAAGISRRIKINGSKVQGGSVKVNMPDIGQEEIFDLQSPLNYTKERDYFKSAINILTQRGYKFYGGIEAEVRGEIPINSGTSSSSALIVTWIHFLIKIADEKPLIEISQEEIGRLAYEAEVLEFGEPGGMMDQFSTAMGNIIYLESTPTVKVKSYEIGLGTFVLGDSQEPKDTLNILKRVKSGMLEIIQKLQKYNSSFSIHNISNAEVTEYTHLLTSDERLLFKSNVSDRDILREAKIMFDEGSIDNTHFGDLLNRHHLNLRDAKKVSTKKIDRMIEGALKAGALGAKINGSGGGGCMFAYAPTNTEKVADAILKQGGIPYRINVDFGTKVLI